MSAEINEIERCFRHQYGRCVATLIRIFGDISLAEEMVQEAFVIAVSRWPAEGIPPNPGGWITTTARNRAIDRLRRESTRQHRHVEAARMYEGGRPDEPTGPMADDQIRLIFTCCHPALAQDAQVALTLRLLGGLETPEIARAFLVPEPTMAQRLVRAKRKIKEAGIPYRIPEAAELPDRLRPVLAVMYLIFNEGHIASAGAELIRHNLCAEAVRLARVLSELMPDEPEVLGLLALLLLTQSRQAARVDQGGSLILLSDQDRSLWDRQLIDEGQEIVRRCLRRNTPGPYQIQAAISAVHSDAPSGAATDWRQILALYDQLIVQMPTDIVALNRAVALAEVEGPAAALLAVENLDLDHYHLFHSTRAHFLVQLNRPVEAGAALDIAITLTANESERRHLERQRMLAGPGQTA